MIIDIAKIERIELKPGELLHVKAAVILSEEQQDEINRLFTFLFPDNKVIISDQKVDISLEAIEAK